MLQNKMQLKFWMSIMKYLPYHTAKWNPLISLLMCEMGKQNCMDRPKFPTN